MAGIPDRRSRAKFPKYATVAERLQTFGSWPSSSHLQPTELAEAGFFYQGADDRVICYSCGEELSGWTPEDTAWGEHERFQPMCEHVVQHRMGGSNHGNGDVDEVVQDQRVEASGGDASHQALHNREDSIQAERDPSTKRDHETIDEEIHRLRHRLLCKTCFKENSCMIILPCCHLSVCAACVEKLQNCNVCQTPIKATVRPYCA